MLQRGVTEDQVRQVLESPEMTVPGDADRTRYIRSVGTLRRLSVVAVIRQVNDTHFIVYTAYFNEMENEA